MPGRYADDFDCIFHRPDKTSAKYQKIHAHWSQKRPWSQTRSSNIVCHPINGQYIKPLQCFKADLEFYRKHAGDLKLHPRGCTWSKRYADDTTNLSGDALFCFLAISRSPKEPSGRPQKVHRYPVVAVGLLRTPFTFGLACWWTMWGQGDSRPRMTRRVHTQMPWESLASISKRLVGRDRESSCTGARSLSPMTAGSHTVKFGHDLHKINRWVYAEMGQLCKVYFSNLKAHYITRGQ